MTYYTGSIAAVPTANKQNYIAHISAVWPMFKSYGATRMVETWGEDVPHGKQTDFYRATKAEDGEVAVFSWTAWPDRATCDAAASAMEAEMHGIDMPEMPFDGMRMMWAGFAPIFDSEAVS